ncbi:MAG: hypothetical protein HQM14_18955 [SAR324 cluster bacterium]|nr:hypothetical protein [SAR324 cluster bacterium]
MMLGIVFSIILSLTLVIAYTTAQFWEEETKRQLSQSLEQSRSILQNFLEVRENNLEIWGSNPLIETIFKDSALAGIFVPSLRLEFERIRKKEPWLLHFFLLQDGNIIYDDSGNFEFIQNHQKKFDGLKNLKELPSESFLTLNLNRFNPQIQQNIILIKKPFQKDGVQIEGSYIIVILDPKVINEKLFGNILIGKRGFVTMASQNIQGELSVQQPKRNIEETKDFEVVSKNWKFYQDIPDQYQSIVLRNKKLSNYPFTVIGVISSKDLKEPIFYLLYLCSIFGGIALIIGFWSAIFYATKLTKPILALRNKAKMISEKGIGQKLHESNTQAVSYLKHFINPNEPVVHRDQKDLDELELLDNTFNSMANKIEEDAKQIIRITNMFGKFVPFQFLNRLSRSGADEALIGKGEADYITILFSDIRSFTTISETMDPEELFQFLNQYLALMNQSIHDNNGFIDKFIGDAIMALFDHPTKDNSQEAQDAVQAALGMQKALEQWNDDRALQGESRIATGIGIHSGTVMIGTVGSEQRMDFTVLGDDVNLASRIEGLTKQYGAGIMISASILRLLRDPTQYQHRELDWVKVKGKSEPVELYEIFDMDAPEVQKMKRKSGRSILRGLTQRKRQEWDKAIALFEKALEAYPDDKAAKAHIERCKQLRHMDLPEDWDGAIALDQK